MVKNREKLFDNLSPFIERIYKSGYWAVYTNNGCCASISSWLKYILDGKYEKIGYFYFLRPNGTGNVYNYILLDGWYYLCDLSTCTLYYKKLSLLETGKKVDYIKNNCISSALVKCKSLEEYSLYISRIQLTKNIEYLFFYSNEHEFCPLSIKKNSVNIELYIPKDKKMHIILKDYTNNIKQFRTDSPNINIDWSK